MIAGLALWLMEAGWGPVPAYVAAWALAIAAPVVLWLLISWAF